MAYIHKKQYGCACCKCDPEERIFPHLPCATPRCSKPVSNSGFLCCYHYNPRWAETACHCPDPVDHFQPNETKGNTMPSNDTTHVHAFHVFSQGNLQFNCLTLEDAKEKAQQLIRNKVSEIIIYQAILKITPKPIEVNEIDLRLADNSKPAA